MEVGLMNEPLRQLQNSLAVRLPHAVLLLRDHGWGEGFLHVYQGGAFVVVEFRTSHGFGVTLVREDETGFEGPDEVYAGESDTIEAVAKLLQAHGQPSFDARLIDGLHAARDAAREVIAMLMGQPGTEERRRRLSNIATRLEHLPAQARTNFTGDPRGVVKKLEDLEQELRTTAGDSPNSVRAKLMAIADRLENLANMTASADKARWTASERHQFPV
jgi:hypothetical protein